MFDLKQLFERFCEYSNEKLYWDMDSGEWTKLVLDFFGQEGKSRKVNVESNYMLIDQVWRGTRHEILLALEHENKGDMTEILNKEVEHLIDLRALQKIGIFYPSEGDEKDFLDKALSKIMERKEAIPLQEQYALILGRSTTKAHRRAIRFHLRTCGFPLPMLEWKMVEEKIIFQARKASPEKV